MNSFDPIEWTQRFERLGGVITFRHAETGEQLWTGVMRLRPGDGAEAERMKSDLADHPEWQEPLTRYARERLSTVQRA
jgi:hypothetical protein